MYLLIVIYPLIQWYMGKFIKAYDPKYYETHNKYISQNGINLTFLKFSDDQWDYFLNELALKYYTIGAIINLILNIVFYLLYSYLDKDPTWILFKLFFGIFFIVFAIMVYKTKKIQ